MVDEGNGLVIRSSGCPLSVAVAHTPEMCAAVETLVAEVSGEPARSCCQHGDRPRCCFAVGAEDNSTVSLAERETSGDLHDRH